MSLTVTILGSGTSSGVPLIGCQCKVCRSKKPKNQRLRASAWLQQGKTSILIDTSTDLRTQAIKHGIRQVNAVLYTHPHADHIHGIDDMRAYNFIQRESIPLYGHEWTKKEIFERFPYIFQNYPTEGSPIPKLEFKLIKKLNISPFRVGPIRVQPLLLPHGTMKDTLGYRTGRFAYITDCSDVPANAIRKLQNLSVLVLDCVRLKPHKTHLNLERALSIAQKIGAKKTFLTHLGHDFEHDTWNKKLPRGVRLAYDGLKIRID